MRLSWERMAALTGIGYVVLFIVAFALGIEVGPSDRETLDHCSPRTRAVAPYAVLR